MRQPPRGADETDAPKGCDRIRTAAIQTHEEEYVAHRPMLSRSDCCNRRRADRGAGTGSGGPAVQPVGLAKGRFSEVVTVNGPGKTIYLAGIGAEDEGGAAGASAPILHPGNPYEQCRYAYDKIKRLLATHGASLGDAVKQVVYVTDVRFQADVAK
jgi:enamine deaminase RidA (YjgF/YER057c/UK114 family)